MPLTNNSVTRHIDPTGDEIKAFLDDDGSFVQAVAIVDENGNQTATSGVPVEVNVSKINGSAGDAFNRLRVSNPYPLFENSSRYDINNTIWHSSTATGGSVTHNTTNAAIQLTTNTQTSASASLVTLKNFRYQPGKGHLVQQTLSIVNPSEENSITKWGYFDDNDGLFFSSSGGVFGVVLRDNGTDTFVAQSNFNLDTLDGNGQSGFNIDLSKSNIYQISFQFLGVGVVEFSVYKGDGSTIPFHRFENANTNTYQYMKTALLPVKYEVINTDTTTAGSGINVLCVNVSSEGGFNPLYYIINGRSTSDFVDHGSNYEIPVLSIRSRKNVNGQKNKVEVIPFRMTICCDSKAAIVRLRKNATLTAGVTSFTTVSDNSSMEYNTTATGLTGGVELTTYAINKDSSADISLTPTTFDINKQSLSYNNAGQQEMLTATIERVGTGVSDTSVLVAIEWAEVR